MRNLVGAALGGLTDKAWLAEIRGTLEGLMPGHMSSLVTLLNNRTEAKEAAEAALDVARRAERAANAELAVLSDEPFGWYRMGSNRIRAGDKVVYNKTEAATVLGQDEKDAYKIAVQTADGKKVVSRNDLTLIEAAPEKKPDPAALAAADKAAKAAGREVQKRFTALQAAEAGVTAVQSRQKNEKTLLENVITAIGGVTPGTPFSLTLNGGEAGNTTIVAVPIGVDVGKVGTNPTAASRIRVRFAVADATREISVPLSQVMNQSGGMAFKLAPGTVLGKITTGGKFTQLAPAASNGSQNAAGILWGPADATAADAAAVVVLRGPAIVNRNDLIWPTGATEPQIATATAALTALGILLR